MKVSVILSLVSNLILFILFFHLNEEFKHKKTQLDNVLKGYDYLFAKSEMSFYELDHLRQSFDIFTKLIESKFLLDKESLFNSNRELKNIYENYFFRILNEERKIFSQSLSFYKIQIDEINMDFEQINNVYNIATLDQKASIIQHNTFNNSWTNFAYGSSYFNKFGNVDEVWTGQKP